MKEIFYWNSVFKAVIYWNILKTNATVHTLACHYSLIWLFAILLLKFFCKLISLCHAKMWLEHAAGYGCEMFYTIYIIYQIYWSTNKIITNGRHLITMAPVSGWDKSGNNRTRSNGRKWPCLTNPIFLYIMWKGVVCDALGIVLLGKLWILPFMLHWHKPTTLTVQPLKKTTYLYSKGYFHAHCHAGKMHREWFKEYNNELKVLTLLPKSTDLNSIKNLWHLLDTKVRLSQLIGIICY